MVRAYFIFGGSVFFSVGVALLARSQFFCFCSPEFDSDPARSSSRSLFVVQFGFTCEVASGSGDFVLCIRVSGNAWMEL